MNEIERLIDRAIFVALGVALTLYGKPACAHAGHGAGLHSHGDDLLLLWLAVAWVLGLIAYMRR